MKSDEEKEEEYDEILDEVAKIIDRTGEAVESEKMVKSILGAAVPAVAMIQYLTSQGVRQKTAEKMILTVWRKWFDDARDRDVYGWREGED